MKYSPPVPVGHPTDARFLKSSFNSSLDGINQFVDVPTNSRICPVAVPHETPGDPIDGTGIVTAMFASATGGSWSLSSLEQGARLLAVIPAQKN